MFEDHKRPYLTVLTPVYNEEKNIKRTLDLLHQKLVTLHCSHELLVVDDGSTDQSVDIVQEMRKLNPAIRLCRHPINRGPGSGILTGIKESHGEFIIFIPADLAMNIDHLERYLEASKTADVIVGLRSDRCDYTWMRKIISWINIVIIQMLFQMSQKQFNYISMYRRSIFDHFEIESRSVFVTAEIMIKARDRGLRIVEVDIGYIPRAFGQAMGSSVRSIMHTLRDLIKFWFKWVCRTA